MASHTVPTSDVPGRGGLRPPERRSLAAQVAEALTAAVLDGRFAPGETLPPERALADELGINRTSLRQAIARMEQAGLVESRQGVGTVVRDPLLATDNGIVLRALAAAGPHIVDELLEVRQPLAALSGRLAASRAGADGRATVERWLAAVREAADPAALQAAELAFFSALVAASANRPLAVMMRWLEDLYGATAPLFVAAFTDPEVVVGGLEHIATAVRHGDADGAGAAAARYAEESGRRLLDAVGRAIT